MNRRGFFSFLLSPLVVGEVKQSGWDYFDAPQNRTLVILVSCDVDASEWYRHLCEMTEFGPKVSVHKDVYFWIKRADGSWFRAVIISKLDSNWRLRLQALNAVRVINT